MAEIRTQKWIIQRGAETREILVSARDAKEVRSKINKEGWAIRSSAYVDSPNYQKAYQKQITKTEFGESGLQQEKMGHDFEREQQIKEKIIMPETKGAGSMNVELPKTTTTTIPTQKEIEQALKNFETKTGKSSINVVTGNVPDVYGGGRTKGFSTKEGTIFLNEYYSKNLSREPQTLLHHEVLHELFPEKGEMSLRSIEDSTLKTIVKTSNTPPTTVYVAPKTSDVGGVIGGVGVSKGFMEKYQEALKTPSIPTTSISTTTVKTTTEPFTDIVAERAQEQLISKEMEKVRKEVFPISTWFEEKVVEKIPDRGILKFPRGAARGIADIVIQPIETSITAYKVGKGLKERASEVGVKQTAKEFGQAASMLPESFVVSVAENPLEFAGEIAGGVAAGWGVSKLAGRLFNPKVKSQTIGVDVSKIDDFGDIVKQQTKGTLKTKVKTGLKTTVIDTDISARSTAFKTIDVDDMTRFDIDTFYGAEIKMPKGSKFISGRSFGATISESIDDFQYSKGFGVKRISEIGTPKVDYTDFFESKEIIKIPTDIDSNYPSSVFIERFMSVSDNDIAEGSGLSRTFELPTEDLPIKPIKPDKTLGKLKPFTSQTTALESLKKAVGDVVTESMKSEIPKISVPVSPFALKTKTPSLSSTAKVTAGDYDYYVKPPSSPVPSVPGLKQPTITTTNTIMDVSESLNRGLKEITGTITTPGLTQKDITKAQEQMNKDIQQQINQTSNIQSSIQSQMQNIDLQQIQTPTQKTTLLRRLLFPRIPNVTSKPNLNFNYGSPPLMPTGLQSLSLSTRKKTKKKKNKYYSSEYRWRKIPIGRIKLPTFKLPTIKKPKRRK